MRSPLPIFLVFLLLSGCCHHDPVPAKVSEKKPGAENLMTPGHQKQDSISGKPSKKPAGRQAVKRRKETPPEQGSRPAQSIRQPDTLLISKLAALRTRQVEPDLSEPLTRDYLFSPVENMPFPTLIELSRDRYFRFRFDNDLLDYTDRFYTNGFYFEYICPAFSGSPLSKVAIPYWRQGINYYGMALTQTMYTSSNTKIGGIQYGDRPYAGCLYLSAFKTTNDPVHLLRQRSELQIGVIGPASLGGMVQTWFHTSTPHNDKPLGWEYQIRNDLLLNYLVSYDKGLVSNRYLELNLTGTGILGTVNTEATGGFYFRFGMINPYFRNLGLNKRSVNRRSGMRNTQCYMFYSATGTAVGYDATLQGGLFNRTSPYTIPADSLSRFRFNGTGGLVLSYGGAQLDVEQHVISPEFKGGLWHLWISIGLTFGF